MGRRELCSKWQPADLSGTGFSPKQNGDSSYRKQVKMRAGIKIFVKLMLAFAFLLILDTGCTTLPNQVPLIDEAGYDLIIIASDYYFTLAENITFPYEGETSIRDAIAAFAEIDDVYNKFLESDYLSAESTQHEVTVPENISTIDDVVLSVSAPFNYPIDDVMGYPEATLLLVDNTCVRANGGDCYKDLFVILRLNLESTALTVDPESFVYTGSQIKPAFTLSIGNNELGSSDTIYESGSEIPSSGNDIPEGMVNPEDLLYIYGENVNAGKDAGSVKVLPGGNESAFSSEAEAKFTIEPKEITLNWKNTSFTFDNTEKVPEAAAGGLIGEDSCDVTVEGAQINAGTYTATAAGLSNSNYKLPEENTVKFTIEKADITEITPPDGKLPAYNGLLQELVTEGSAEGGTIIYCFEDSCSESIPSGMLPGDYTIHWYVKGDGNHNDAGSREEPLGTVKTIIREEKYYCFSGEGQTYKKGSGGELEFIIKHTVHDQFTAALFRRLSVDGIPLTDKDSAVMPGSLKITLKNSFLETLQAGTHTLSVVFEDGSCDIQFSVVNGDHPEPPEPPEFPQFFRLEPLPGETLPKTGFSASAPTLMTEQPKALNYKPLGITLEIPSLSIIAEIVSVPFTDGEYPVAWLGRSAGMLEGSAMPGEGRTYLTGHNHLSTTEAGPFALLKWLEEGDRIFVTDPNGGMKSFTVYASESIGEADFAALERIASAADDPLILITCEDEKISGGYASRRIIAAK